jgi:hypothetical protein
MNWISLRRNDFRYSAALPVELRRRWYATAQKGGGVLIPATV